MKLISWNVNGLRAVLRGGFADFLAAEQPDVLCLQEIKAAPGDITTPLMEDYHVTWNPAAKRGYSGVLLASRQAPVNISLGLGLAEHDTEGRIIAADLGDFYVVTCYTPNSQRELVRLPYRLSWDAAFREWLQRLDREKPVLVCGDLNCSPEEIDLANPKSNRRNAGFSDEERASFSQLLAAGFVDSFRMQHPGEPGHYTWWTYRNEARARNIGWRLDYWLVSQRFWPRVTRTAILKDVFGSDHCPVLIEIQ